MRFVMIVLPLALVAGLAVVRQVQSATAAERLEHVRNSFEFDIPAPLKTAFPLFGAHGERGWAGDQWNPEFVYPQPEQDVAGMVFTLDHHGRKSTWVNTAFDAEHGHAQYVYVIPGLLATVIDVRLVERNANNTHVTVVYERTALSAEANDHVQKLGNDDRGNAAHWQQAINAYLERQRK